MPSPSRSGRTVQMVPCRIPGSHGSRTGGSGDPPLRSSCTSPVGWHGVSRDGGSHRPRSGRCGFAPQNHRRGRAPALRSHRSSGRARACPRRHGPAGPCKWCFGAFRDSMDPGRAGQETRPYGHPATSLVGWHGVSRDGGSHRPRSGRCQRVEKGAPRLGPL